MSKSQNQLSVNGWSDTRGIERPVLILERQLMNILGLRCHVQQARIWSNDATPLKIRRLFDGMSSELKIFSKMIQKRLESLQSGAQHFTKGQSDSPWQLFASDNLNVREQLQALLCSHARYMRETSKAIATLQRWDELECRKLLETMFAAADRRMWFLEMYLEGLVLNTDTRRLPDWPPSTAS